MIYRFVETWQETWDIEADSPEHARALFRTREQLPKDFAGECVAVELVGEVDDDGGVAPCGQGQLEVVRGGRQGVQLSGRYWPTGKAPG